MSCEEWPEGMPVDQGPDDRSESPEAAEDGSLYLAARRFMVRFLPHRQRKVIDERLQGVPYKEIADEMGLEVQKAHALWATGLRTLRAFKRLITRSAQETEGPQD